MARAAELHLKSAINLNVDSNLIDSLLRYDAVDECRINSVSSECFHEV
jgi:hypothetical protein